MENSPKSIRYTERDRQPLTIEELSRYARVSPAFVRLCIDSGCPAQDNRLSQETLLEWLALNYAEVRYRAALRPLAAIAGVQGRPRRALELANALLTVLEYKESRATERADKLELLEMIQHVARRA